MTRDDLGNQTKPEIMPEEISDIKKTIDREEDAGSESPVDMLRMAAQEIEAAWHPWEIDPARPSEEVLRGEDELPSGYGRTRAVLLVRDPFWLHCYWEVSPDDRARIMNEFGRDLAELPQMLRVFDLTAAGNETIYYDIHLQANARCWYLETGKPGHCFVVEYGFDFPGRGFTPIVRSNAVTTPPADVSDLVDEEWMAVDEHFAKLYRLGAGLGPGQSSVEIVESLTQRLARRLGSGAVSSLGSGFRQALQRHFWLVVGTELIVYGATEPDANVSMNGQPVTLRADGTFSARFALGDGRVSLPITAVSGTGQDQITIIPTVIKETH